MDLVAELKALMRQRGEHEAALREIDLKLADARRVLGIAAPTVPTGSRVSFPRLRRPRTQAEAPLTRQRILDALAEREPLCAHELIEATGCTTAGQVVANMWADGKVVRVRGWKGDQPRRYYYARSQAAFGDVITETPADKEAADAIEAEAG